MMNPNEQLSEDQPVETGDPYNATDVAGEFDAMTGNALPQEPQEPEVADAPVEPVVDSVEPEVVEPEVVDAPDWSALQAEVYSLKAQLEASRSGNVEPTIGELTSPFAPKVNEDEVFANRNYLGLAPGTTPEVEYEQALGSWQGLNSFANRIRQSIIRDTLMMLPSVLDSHLQHNLAVAQADSQFWEANGDLKPKMEVVNAIAAHIRTQQPNLPRTAFYKVLADTTRKHLNMPRPVTKSNGSQPLPQRGAPKRAQPTLAGGTGNRRIAPQQTPFASEFSAMERAIR